MQMVDLRYDIPIVGHMGLKMASLRDIHWESSHLVYKQELMYVLLLADQMGRIMENLRDIH